MPATLKFVIPSDARYLAVVRGALGPLTLGMGCDEAESRAIVLAVDEALSNVIRHAYHSRTDGVIELECRETPEELQFTLTDTGETPDLTKICARQIACDQPGGLGTHIIQD